MVEHPALYDPPLAARKGEPKPVASVGPFLCQLDRRCGCSDCAYCVGALREDDRSRAQAFVASLGHARTQDVPAIVAEMSSVRKWADPLLRARLASATASTPARLHTAMALLPVDRTLEGTVYEGMLTASPKEIAAIRDALVSGGDRHKLSERLWGELLDSRRAASRRFRAGVALALLDPPVAGAPSGRWGQASGFLSEQLIAELTADTTAVDSWIELLTPVRAILYADLRKIFVDTKRPQIDRHLAATVLGEFVAQQPRQLTDLMLEAEPDQYAILLPKLHRLGEAAREALVAELSASIPAAGPAEARRTPVRRRAYAAVALLEFGSTDPLVATLSATSDPDLCTYAENRVSSVAARPDLLLRLVGTAGVPLRAALLRCLGGMRRDKLPEKLQEPAGFHCRASVPDRSRHGRPFGRRMGAPLVGPQGSAGRIDESSRERRPSARSPVVRQSRRADDGGLPRPNRRANWVAAGGTGARPVRRRPR